MNHRICYSIQHGLMKAINLLLVTLFLLPTWWPAFGANESCIECHTEEAILESLVSVPKTAPPNGVGPAGPPTAISPKTYHKRYLIDKTILSKDVHFANGCSFCHQGDEKSTDQEKAHKGIVKKPSADLKICANCHGDITETYQGASHYTVRGMLGKASKRFSQKEGKVFAEKVFGQSCRTCHGSCGDCHVGSPAKDRISAGFLKGHAFVKKDEGKTCAVCHGGRVYPEYTGKATGKPDVHFEKGMACIDCHKKEHLHGNMDSPSSGKRVAGNKPKCRDCHEPGKEAKTTAKLAHRRHEGKVSCYGCHAQGEYTNCYGCHIGKGATAKSGFILGAHPDENRVLTTLRAIPVARDTFADSGLKMERFDQVPDYRATSVHNIQKNTERTRSCDTCHVKKKGFLLKESLPKKGSKANEKLIFRMGPLSIH